MIRSDDISIVDIFTNWNYLMNYKYTFTICVIFQHRVGAANLKHSLKKITPHLSCTVNSTAADN